MLLDDFNGHHAMQGCRMGHRAPRPPPLHYSPHTNFFLASAVTVGETEEPMDSASVRVFTSSFAYSFVRKSVREHFTYSFVRKSISGCTCPIVFKFYTQLH